MKVKKRGVSPIIATVLLISIVVVLGLIIFLWFRGITEEAITKFDGTNIKLVCADVDFEATYFNGVLSISNNGNVPIYGMKLKIFKAGGYETEDISKISSWPNAGLKDGAAFSDNIESAVGSDVTEMVIIPVLLGESSEGKVSVTCADEYSQEITV